jgi:hypothetical protein
MSLEQTMKWANEKINEQAVENGKLQQRIAELEAAGNKFLDGGYVDFENGMWSCRWCSASAKEIDDYSCKPDCPTLVFQQPDSGVQSK